MEDYVRSLAPVHRREGAGERCEIMNRSLLDRRLFDGLDCVLVG